MKTETVDSRPKVTYNNIFFYETVQLTTNTMTFQISSIKIVLIVTILFYTCTVSSVNVDGISCFKCYAVQPEHERSDLLCSQFDGSARFQVFCPLSTFCTKKTVHYQLKTSLITVIERDCAFQKNTNPIYDYLVNMWRKNEEVEETAYKEGCFLGEDRGALAGPREYCACSSHLCNSSQSIKVMSMYHIFTLLMMILLVKLI